MKKKLLILLLLLMICPIVYAQSDLYSKKGRFDWFNEYNAAGAIEDIITTDKGYLAVGYLDDHSIIEFLTHDYKLDFALPKTYNVDFQKVYEEDGYYYALGSNLSGMGYYGIKFDKDGNVLDEKTIYTQWWINKDTTRIYEKDGYYYFFDYGVNSYNDGLEYDKIVKISKDLTDQDWEIYSDLSNTEQKKIKDFATIMDQYKLDDSGNHAGPLFIKEYKDGFIYGLFDVVNGSNGYIYYYAHDGEVWQTIYEGNHISDAVPFKNGLLIWDTPNISYESKLLYLDENGKIIKTDTIDEYFSDVEDYVMSLSYKIIPVGDGFVLTSEYHYELYGSRPIGPNDGSYSLLFFVEQYNIQTKSEGNGKIVVSKEYALNGDEVAIAVTPDEGYVLGSLKVYDANGNEVSYKQVDSYTFIMPSADVTIEANFVKKSASIINISNPKTTSLEIVVIMLIAGISSYLVFHNHKKIKLLNQK